MHSETRTNVSAITLQRLTKVYPNGVPAVRELDLEVRAGEFLVMVGASGSGKSTALRMIAGLELPTSGRVHIGDTDVTDRPPQDRDLAMVFQNYALYPHMTVRQNLAFGLEMRRTPRARAAALVDDVARKLDLVDLLDRRPAALSGGQRQRVALGRAIVRQPRAFLFDEPLSNLDARLRVNTRAELVALHRQLRATMVYVTHDQTEAMTMGQRIAVLHDGVLHQCAPPLEVYDAPADLTVARFIGSPSMNTFSGTLTATPEGANFRASGLELVIGQRTAVKGDVVLGIRPEHVTLLDADSADADIRAQVEVIEPLGAETLIHTRTHAATVVIRTPDRSNLKPGQVTGLTLDRTRIHLFDASTGLRLP